MGNIRPKEGFELEAIKSMLIISTVLRHAVGAG
jgi:hypothetical protein